jgi:hypothetical protein
VDTRLVIQITKSRLALNKGGLGSGHFGHAGRPGERGGSAPSGGSTSIRGTLVDRAKGMAEEHDLPLNRLKINTEARESKTEEVVGQYNEKTGRVELYRGAFQSERVLRETIAHETQHWHFAQALKTDRTLKRDIMRSISKLQKEDGVTAYSRWHWKFYRDSEGMNSLKSWGEMHALLAVNETLAEMSARKSTTGKLPGSTAYRSLYARVRRASRRSR